MIPAVSILASLILLIGSTSVSAQEYIPLPEARESIASTKEGISGELEKEYISIITRNKAKGNDWHKDFEKRLSTEDRDRLETIFLQMNREQQRRQVVSFRAPGGPLPKLSLTADLIKEWKDKKAYQIRMNEKDVKNTALDAYTHRDFSHVLVRKLPSTAVNASRPKYQVNLMTNDYFEKYNAERIGEMKNIMVFSGFTYKVRVTEPR